MAITELAILRLNSPTPSKSTLSTLKRAKSAMEHSSGHRFYYFTPMNDPSIIYIIGAWPSIEYHNNEWLPSAENQEILRLLEGEVKVEAMFHVDIDQTKTSIPTGKEVLGITRLFVHEGKKNEFKWFFTWGGIKGDIDSSVGDENAVGGWRVDLDVEGGEEFVLFTGWDSTRRLELKMASEYPGFEEIDTKGCVSGVDVKYARLLNVEGEGESEGEGDERFQIYMKKLRFVVII